MSRIAEQNLYACDIPLQKQTIVEKAQIKALKNSMNTGKKVKAAFDIVRMVAVDSTIAKVAKLISPSYPVISCRSLKKKNI